MIDPNYTLVDVLDELNDETLTTLLNALHGLPTEHKDAAGSDLYDAIANELEANRMVRLCGQHCRPLISPDYCDDCSDRENPFR